MTIFYRTRSDYALQVNFLSDLHLGGYKEQLYHCKAWIIKSNFSDFLILQSYSSIVAAYEFETGILWVFAFYSNTTAQHVTKFQKWLRYRYNLDYLHFKRVNLYNDSRTGKRAAKKNLDDDFASVIASALYQR